MGFCDSLSKGWSFVMAAFRMAGENRKLLAPSVYQVLLIIVYFVAWVAALIVIDPRWSDGTWAAVSALCVFGSFLISFFCSGMTVNMIDVHLKGGTPTLGEGARDAAKNFPAIVVLSLISTIVNAIASAARDNDSIVGRIIAGIIEAVWTTLALLLLPAIIIEDAGFGQAMRRVRAIHKDNLLLIGVGEVGVRAVLNLIGFAWMLLTFGVVYLSFTAFSGTTALVLAFTLGGTLLALFSAFSTYLRMAYYTCLYLWAVEVEAKGQDAPAPLPLAVALGRAPLSSTRRAA